jgi:hypothetical protein
MRGSEQAAGGSLPSERGGVVFNPNAVPPAPPAYVIPLPFDDWEVISVVLAVNADNWLDQNNKLQNRRAWAVMNGNAVVGNDCYVGPRGMTAINQGGLCPAPFGWVSIPGGPRTQVHAFTVLAGIRVFFYQFA